VSATILGVLGMLIANDRQNISSSFVELALLLLRREGSSIQRFKYANLPGLSLSFDGEILDCFYLFLLSNPLFPHPSGGKEKKLISLFLCRAALSPSMLSSIYLAYVF